MRRRSRVLTGAAIAVVVVAGGLVLADVGLRSFAEGQAQAPLGRTGRVSDIAPIAVFLACDEGQYVTGQTINADGGQIML